MTIDHDLLENAYNKAVLEVVEVTTGINMQSFTSLLDEVMGDLKSAPPPVVKMASDRVGDTNDESDKQDLSVRTDRITAMMLLPGQRNSLLLLSMPKESAVRLTSLMTGLSPDQLDENDSVDGLTETANLIAGSARASFYGTAYDYRLTAPFALLGSEYDLFQKENIERVYMNFAGGGLLLTLEVYYLD